MNVPDLLVITAGVALSGLLAWFFFGPRKAGRANLVGQVQEARITVKGGYSPDRVRVRQGVPLRLVFDRQESGDCTSRVVFPDLGLNRSLPAFTTTTVELIPRVSGEFGFACGMNMVHGTLVVETASVNGAEPATDEDTVPSQPPEAALEAGGDEAAERR